MICVWRRQWAAFGLRCGSQWPPRNADCRGGVFAVFAKISPPTYPPYARIPSDFSPYPIPYMVFGIICSLVMRMLSGSPCSSTVTRYFSALQLSVPMMRVLPPRLFRWATVKSEGW